MAGDRSDSLTYRAAGVDIAAGAALVERIKPLAAATRRTGSVGELGGFGGLFDVRAAGFKDPILVAATDGVGTKLEIARAVGDHDGVGIDLVAMCVNDLIVQGAEPLFFLDYMATGRLDIGLAERVIAGIGEGCRQAGCALIGGETAEHPGTESPEDYDLAGFAVGAVERNRLLTGRDIAAGDIVLGLAASGLHSNGFSLVRRIVEAGGLDYRAPAPFAPDRSLGAALLTPTRIYVADCLGAIRAGLVKGLAHITGGGLMENLPRSLPAAVAANIDITAWPLPPVFAWLKAQGNVAATEMLTTFNCGIGMVAIVAPGHERAARDQLAAGGQAVYRIGEIVPRAEGGPALSINPAAGRWEPKV